MNIYALVILVTLLLDYGLNLLADLLNLRALRHALPEEFVGVYDPETYHKAQEYTRVQTRFGLCTATCMLMVTLLFWFAGGFQALDVMVRGWHVGPLWTGVGYIGLLMLGRALLSLPFRLYATFVIEARFGFNKTTLVTFITDGLKALLLGLAIGGPLLVGILALFTYAGTQAWLYCWGVTTLFTLALQWLAPTWILPLFNTFTPLADGELRQAIFAYARAAHFPVDDVCVMDGSRRSSKSNAFFTGFGRHKRIALFDTLIAQHTPAELVAVLAHEIGHYKKKHIVKNMLISMAHTAVVFWLLSVFLSHPGLFQAFYVTQPAVYTGLIFFALLYTPVELLLSVVMHVMSRQHEYEADRFAAETLEHPSALTAALKKLSANNLSNLTPHPFYVFLHYSHPPMLQRVRAIQRGIAYAG